MPAQYAMCAALIDPHGSIGDTQGIPVVMHTVVPLKPRCNRMEELHIMPQMLSLCDCRIACRIAIAAYQPAKSAA